MASASAVRVLLQYLISIQHVTTDEQRKVIKSASPGEPHLRPPTLAALSLTQDPWGNPFGVLSFLPYSQTLGPSSPLSAGSLFRSATPVFEHNRGGVRPLDRDISSGFSDSLFFASALFNSPVASFSTFRKVLRQVFTGSWTRWVRSPAYDRSPDSGSGRAPGVRNRSWRSSQSQPERRLLRRF